MQFNMVTDAVKTCIALSTALTRMSTTFGKITGKSGFCQKCIDHNKK